MSDSDNDNEEIISPPFLTERATVPRMLKMLNELREWVIDHREWANFIACEHGAQEPVIPDEEQIPKIPDQKRYLVISIPDLWTTFQSIRSLRESWDALVRYHEDTWTCDKALAWRLHCIRGAYIILSEAFVDPETREAKQQAERVKHEKYVKKMLRKMGVPKELLRGDAWLKLSPFGVGMGFREKHPKNIDFDELFHGKPGDEPLVPPEESEPEADETDSDEEE